jgi:hypothetical protein
VTGLESDSYMGLHNSPKENYGPRLRDVFRIGLIGMNCSLNISFCFAIQELY